MNFYRISDDFVKKNNERILSTFKTQHRYVPQKEPDTGKVSDNHKLLLMEIYKYQYRKTLTEICKSAGFSAGTGSRNANDCVEKNLVKMVNVKIFRGNPKYPVLLPEAYEILGMKEKKFYGKGAGYEHILYQHLIANHFSDYKPVIEMNRNNKFIDIGIETNQFLIAIEVAMTSVHEKENIEKDFELAKADFALVACLNKKVLKEVNEIFSQLLEKIRNKTKTYLLSELLNIKPDELINNLQLSLNL